MADFVKPSPVIDLFSSSVQLIIPRFQRKYEWSCAKSDDEIQTLWEDILQACTDNRDHYIGAIVIMPYQTGTGLHKHYLIDGQQRCTTLSILFRALCDYISVENNTNYPNICKKLIIEEDYNVHKLVRSSEGDDYARLIDSVNLGEHYLPRKTCAERCYQYFCTELQHLKDNPELGISIVDVYETVKNRIKVVMITVSDEDPCVIFESLNNTGKKLTAVSMVRNYVMLRCASIGGINNDEFQDDVYKTYWTPFEKLTDNDEAKLGEYLRTYLMMSGKRVTKSEIYRNVKDHVDDETKNAKTTTEMKAAVTRLFSPWLNDYSLYLIAAGEARYDGSGNDATSINRSLDIINVCGFKSQRSYVLKLLIECRDGRIDKHQVAVVLRMLESYVVRRTLHRDLVNNTVDLLFLEMCEKALFDPRAVFDKLKGESGAGIWPTDNDIESSLTIKDFYSDDRKGFCNAVLSRIDTSLVNGLESVISNQTVEHIFPQTPSDDWKRYLGDDFKFMTEHVHRIGNVTIMDSSLNTSSGNKSYPDKINVYKQSKYTMTNRLPREYEAWNKESFEKRNDQMIGYALEVWPSDYKSFTH